MSARNREKEKESIAWESRSMKAVKGVAAFWERDWNSVSRFGICDELALHANKLGYTSNDGTKQSGRTESQENSARFHSRGTKVRDLRPIR